MMIATITRLDAWFSRHSRTIRKVMLWGEAIGFVVCLILGWHLWMMLFLIGFHFELNQIELTKLRQEIRAKRRWDEGQA